MPEHDPNKKERILSGETIVSSSSDEAIRARLKDLTREYHGLSDTEVIDEPEEITAGESLPPEHIISAISNLEVAKVKGAVDLRSRLTPQHSALGLALQKERQVKKTA